MSQVIVPGLDPWDEVLRNPYVWHFALHSVPDLPETLVQGHQSEYFDYFYRAISADPAKITPEARAAYAKAYSTNAALTAGFNWYPAFRQDAATTGNHITQRRLRCSTSAATTRAETSTATSPA